jgi:hypothetical protein
VSGPPAGSVRGGVDRTTMREFIGGAAPGLEG